MRRPLDVDALSVADEHPLDECGERGKVCPIRLEMPRGDTMEEVIRRNGALR